MADIKNELGWSRTRMGQFQSCKRSYYYQYYAKWGGWDSRADELSKTAYRLSKMTNLPMLVGSAVHTVIEHILLDLKNIGRIDMPDPAYFARKNLLTPAYKDALAERWRRSPKHHPPLAELYYGPDPDPETLKDSGRKTSNCIENFLQSRIFHSLQDDDCNNWLAIEPSFEEAKRLKVDGKVVWACPDFARRVEGDICEVWDWKTGKPRPEDELQLLSYGLFAHEVWGFSPDQIKLCALYLGKEPGPNSVVSYPCSRERLDSLLTQVRSDFAEMDTLLTDPDQNIPHDPDSHFPMIPEGPTCGYCFFRQLCDRGAPQQRT